MDTNTQGLLFSRSYEVILQSSLTRVSLSALDFSSWPPVSVYSTGSQILTLEAFLGSVGFAHSSYDCISYLRYNSMDLPIKSSYILLRTLPFVRAHTLLRPSITIYDWHRNINLFSGSQILTLEAFLGSVGFAHSSYDCISYLRYNSMDFPIKSSYILLRTLPFVRAHTLLRPSITIYDWHRNINLFSIRLRIIAWA